MVSYIAQLESEFWKKMGLFERGRAEMTPEYAYDFVFFLSEMFFGLSYEAEEERRKYWLSVSKPEWMSIVVHNFIHFDYTLREVDQNRPEQKTLEVTWKNQACEVLSNLLDHYGPDTLPLLTPLLEQKGHRGYFFSLIWDCSHEFEILDLVARFAEPEAGLDDWWDLEQYIALLAIQDAERAIPLLEKVRRNYSHVQMPVPESAREPKTTDELIDRWLESFKKHGRWEKPKWGWELEQETPQTS